MIGKVFLRAALLFVLLSGLAQPAFAQEPNQAVIIVDYGDGRVDNRCISFSESSITGVDLIMRSGIEVQLGAGSIGTQVCKIGEVGCDVTRQPCFCQCLGAECRYWTYFQWRNGAWMYSPVGAALRQIGDGDADAWVWGDGKRGPSISPQGICQGQQEAAIATIPAPATDTPMPTALPATDTPLPAVTATAATAPTATVESTQQNAPTATPTTTLTDTPLAVSPTGASAVPLPSATTATVVGIQSSVPMVTPAARPGLSLCASAPLAAAVLGLAGLVMRRR